MRWALLGAVVVATALVGPQAGGAARSSVLRLNDVQVVGTHNSYHVEPSPEALSVIMSVDPQLVDLAYTHAPLAFQLRSEAIRQVELDVFADPDGTRWRPIGTSGFKVFHMEQVDMGSTCDTLVVCLGQLEAWSHAHPRHLPVFVLLQPNDDITLPGPPNPVPITTPVLDALDDEIRSVVPARDLITPDQVRGHASTLEAAVLADGWPELDDARGKFVFLALDTVRAQYVVGHPNLEGRVMFPASTPGQPDAGFINIDDPRGSSKAVIRDLVRKGYLVRTRADEPVITPRSGDLSQRAAAFASGAQIISTDYPSPWSAARWDGSGYVVRLPGHVPARCNPIRITKCPRHGLGEESPGPS